MQCAPSGADNFLCIRAYLTNEGTLRNPEARTFRWCCSSKVNPNLALGTCIKFVVFGSLQYGVSERCAIH